MVELFDSLPAGPGLHTFVSYSIAFCSRSEADNHVIYGVCMRLIVADKAVRFCDNRLNSSQ